MKLTFSLTTRKIEMQITIHVRKVAWEAWVAEMAGSHVARLVSAKSYVDPNYKAQPPITLKREAIVKS